MKMYDVEIALNGIDVWITQDDGNGGTSVVALHPDQVPVICEWLMQAIGAKTAISEVSTNNAV